MFNVTDCLNFGVGESSTSENNICFSSSKELLCEYEWLIFLDSRGLERDCSIEKTWLFKLCASFDERNISYLAVSRPKNITVFATLVNFINLNDIHFTRLLTNLGFVDCTPKKNVFIKDIEKQIKEFFYHNLSICTFPQYLNSDGELINLYSLQYNDVYLNSVAKYLSFSFAERYFITTPLTEPSLAFKRQRPDCFYKQLGITNNLIRAISTLSGTKVIDVAALCLTTFDGVHFTDSDHEQLGNNMIKWVL
jgi:hypothetical protein